LQPDMTKPLTAISASSNSSPSAYGCANLSTGPSQPLIAYAATERSLLGLIVA